MGEGETVSEVIEAPANGNVAVEDKGEAIAKDLREEKDGNKEVKGGESKESDKNDAEKMDIDQEEAKETKGGEEVNENKKEEETKENNEKEEEAKENNEKEEEVKESNETKEEEKPDQEIEVEVEKLETKSEAMEEEPDNKDKEEEMAEDQDNKDDDEEMAEEPDNKDEEVKEEASGEKEDKESNEKQKNEEGSKKSVKSKGEKDKKRKREVEQKKEKEPKTPTPPTIDRPVRERKSVERLVASIDREANKEFRIEKGRGTALKDIPNVAYKLSKKKTEETFKLLHTILYGRRGKAAQIKSNISRFSGFVWHENEEKQKMKVKEKLDKYIKEKLLEFCDVLDIPVSKATSRKEDMVVKLMDFLEAPHATTSELLAEKEQSSKGKKRRRESKKSPSSASVSSKGSTKSRKKTETPSQKVEKKKKVHESEDESEQEVDVPEEESEEEKANGVPERSDDEKSDQADSEKESESEHEAEPEPEPEPEPVCAHNVTGREDKMSQGQSSKMSHTKAEASASAGGAQRSGQDLGSPDESSSVPLGLGLSGLQPKRRTKQSVAHGISADGSTSNNPNELPKGDEHQFLQSLASLAARGNETAMPSGTHSDRGVGTGNRSSNGQSDIADAMSSVIQSPALNGLLSGVSQQTGAGSPDLLRNMMQQLTQSPAMMNTVSQIAQQIDTQDLGSMFSGQGGGMNLSRMFQQMMPIVSQALGGISAVPQQIPNIAQRPGEDAAVIGATPTTENVQIDLHEVAQEIENNSPPVEILRSLVQSTESLQHNGSTDQSLADELSSEEDLANELMKMLRNDVSKRFQDKQGQ